MCFLITAVVEFLVVVQTGAIDLLMGGVWMRITSDGCQEHLNMPTSAAWCHLLNKLGPDLCKRFFLCDAIESELLRLLQFLSFTFLKNKSHYTLMPPSHPPLLFLMSLDISTKSQRVAPQARRRYLVIYIEMYGPKWGEGSQGDCLSAYQYLVWLLCSFPSR